MQAGDYGERSSEPWTYRKRVVPLRTYSGRVVHDRSKHFFTIGDVSRILAKIQPPDDTPDASQWANRIIQTLRDATLGMLERILWFLDQRSIEALYEFGVGILDKMFQVDQEKSSTSIYAQSLIIQIADRAGFTVTIKKN